MLLFLYCLYYQNLNAGDIENQIKSVRSKISHDQLFAPSFIPSSYTVPCT